MEQLAIYRVVGVIRLKGRPGDRFEQVPVRQTVTAAGHAEAFALVRAPYNGRLADSDLTCEEVGRGA